MKKRLAARTHRPSIAPPSRSRSKNVNLLSASAFGAGVGAICVCALLFIFSLLCLLTRSGDKLTSLFSILTLAVSFFACGFAGAKKRPAAIPVGLCSGALLSLFLWLISLFINDSLSLGLSFPVELLIRISIVAVSLVGALLGVNLRSRR